MEQTRVTYALRVKATGELVRLLSTPNADPYACGERRYEWVTGRGTDGYPLYEVATPRVAMRALKESTPWYNSSERYPMHGSLDPAGLEIVKRTVVETHEPVALELPPVLKLVLEQRKPARLLARYAGGSLPDEATTLVIGVLPPGESLDSLRRFEGQDLETDEWGEMRRIYRVFAVPEDYLYDLKDRPGFAAVTGDHFIPD